MISFLLKSLKNITRPTLAPTLLFVFIKPSFAAGMALNSKVTTQQVLTSNQTITIGKDANLTTTDNISLIKAEGFGTTGANIIVEASGSNGISNVSTSSPAIYISGGANLASLDLRSGSITSNNSAIRLNTSGSTKIITASGTTISSNSAAIAHDPLASTELSIINAGSIISKAQAIYSSVIYSSKLSIVNSGLIQGSSSIHIASRDSRETEIINESGGVINGIILFTGYANSQSSITNRGSINGDITSKLALQYNNLAITNNAGSINGNIILGNHASSSFTLNGGSINGNLTSGNATQYINLNGGSFNGNISLFSRSTLNLSATELNGSVDSDSHNSASVNLTANNIIKSDTKLGSINGLAAVNIFKDKVINVNGSIKTQNLNIASNATLNLGSDNVYATTTSLNGTLNFGNISRTINSNIIGHGTGNINLSDTSHNVIGNLTLKSGDSLNIKLTNANTFGKITVSGITSIDKNTNLNIVISPNYRFIVNGSKYTIIDGQDGSSISAINDSKINVNNSNTNQFSLLTFTTDSVNNDLILSATRKSATLLTSNVSSQNVYNLINKIGSSATGELKSFQEYLDNSTDKEQVKEALNSVTLQDNSSVNFTHMNVVNNSVKTTENRMDAVHFSLLEENKIKSLGSNIKEASYKAKLNFPNRTSGLSFGDSLANNGIWAQTFGTAAKQNNINENDGYNSKSLGFAFGYDKEIVKNTRLGLSLSYANSNIKSLDSLKKTNIDTYQINAYSGYSLGKYFLNTILGFSWNDYDSKRTISAINSIATANYAGKTYVAKIRGGFVKDIGNGFNITPETSINFVHNNTDSYVENGAGNLNLVVRSSSSDFLEGRLGLNLGYGITTKKYTKISPKISASYGYNFLNNRQTTTSNFVGQATTFNNLSSKIDPKSLKLGAGIDIYGTDSFTVSSEYIMEKKNRYQSHSGVIRIRFEY